MVCVSFTISLCPGAAVSTVCLLFYPCVLLSKQVSKLFLFFRRVWRASDVWPRQCDSWDQRRTRSVRPRRFSVCPVGRSRCTVAARQGRRRGAMPVEFCARAAPPATVPNWASGTGCRKRPNTGATLPGRRCRPRRRSSWAVDRGHHYSRCPPTVSKTHTTSSSAAAAVAATSQG